MSRKIDRQAAAQGKLDGLCGVYSIINGIALIERKRMTEEDRRALFVYLVDLLDDGRGIGTIVQAGISFRALGRLIDVASRRRRAKTQQSILRQTAMKQIPDNIDDFWKVLVDHVDTAERRVAILGVSGRYNHWTVVKSVSSRRIELQDSSGLTHLDRSKCTLNEGEGIHVLWPTQTYLLSLEDTPTECV